MTNTLPVLEDDDGNIYELIDTGNYKIFNILEQGKIYKKGDQLE